MTKAVEVKRLLGARQAQGLRAWRYRVEGAQPQAYHDLADGLGSGAEDRCHLRGPAVDQ